MYPKKLVLFLGHFGDIVIHGQLLSLSAPTQNGSSIPDIGNIVAILVDQDAQSRGPAVDSTRYIVVLVHEGDEKSDTSFV